MMNEERIQTYPVSDWWKLNEFCVNLNTIGRTNRQICQVNLRAASAYIKGTLTHNGFMGRKPKNSSKTCSKGHQRIQFKGDTCPMCNLLEEIKMIEKGVSV